MPIRYETNQNNNLNINYVRVNIYDPNMKSYTMNKLMKSQKQHLKNNNKKKNLTGNSNDKASNTNLDVQAEASCYQTMAFGTNLNINRTNIKDIVKFGRTRWHIENTSFRVLKLGNFHFNRNFQHGHHNMADITSIFQLLVYNIIILGFIFDTKFRDLLTKFSTLDAFIQAIIDIIKHYSINNYEQLVALLSEPNLFSYVSLPRAPPDGNESNDSSPLKYITIDGKRYFEEDEIRPGTPVGFVYLEDEDNEN